MHTYQALVKDLGQIKAVVTKIDELELQLAAFDSPEAVARRQKIRERRQEQEVLTGQVNELEDWLDTLLISDADEVQINNQALPEDSEAAALFKGFAAMEQTIRLRFVELKASAHAEIETSLSTRAGTACWQAIVAAEQVGKAYVEVLIAKGIDPDAYNDIQTRLRAQQSLLKQIKAKESARDAALQAVEVSWQTIVNHLVLG